MLFGSAHQDARRQLVSAIVAQVKAAGADGVNLDFSFRPAPARPVSTLPAPTPAAPAKASHQAPPAQHKAKAAAPAAGTKQQEIVQDIERSKKALEKKKLRTKPGSRLFSVLFRPRQPRCLALHSCW